jgi:hypothetical protein
MIRSACVATLLLTGIAANAYVNLRNDTDQRLRWTEDSVVLTLHQNLDPRVLDGSDEVAVREAAATWEREGGPRFRFDDAPQARARTDWASDDVHMVWWDTDNSSGLFPPGSGLVAVTPIDFDPTTGEILDADVIVNARQVTSTRGDADAFDLQSVITHELGHLLGLDHSPLAGSTMAPVPVRGDTSLRTLAPDERAALHALYPTTSPRGSVVGVVRRADGSPVRGAHVVAEDLDGQPAGAVLTDLEGRFDLAGLAPGDYVLYAEPLFATAHLDARTRARGIETDFGTTFWGPSGQSSALQPATLRVSTGAATSARLLEVRAPGALQQVRLTPEVLVPGERVRLRAQGQGLRGSLTFVLTAPLGAELPVSDPMSGLGVAHVTVDVPAHARPQLHSLRVVNAAGDCWVGGGVIEVRDPAPLVLDVSPRVLAPGAPVEVQGERLQPGAFVVVGSERVATTGAGSAVTFLAPNLPAGHYDLTLENPDGQIATLKQILEVPGAPGAGSAPPPASNPSAGAAPPVGAPAPTTLAPSGGGGSSGGGCALQTTTTVGRPAGALLMLLAFLAWAGVSRAGAGEPRPRAE